MDDFKGASKQGAAKGVASGAASGAARRTARSRTRRAALLATVALSLAAPAARAQDGTAGGAGQDAAPRFQSDNALARFLLPYSPILFDFAVQAGRSFAEITYGGRDYDPVTASFVVSDLHIRRDALDVSVARMRVGQAATLLQGVAIDTAGLDLPPPLRDGLRRLNKETVTGDVVVGLRTDERRAAYDLAVQVDFPAVGALSLAAAVDGFHVLVPLADLPTPEGGESVSQPPTILGTLRHLDLTYRDRGLMDVATAIAAEQQGVSADQMSAGLVALPGMTVGGMLADLPGGASPGLRDQAAKWAAMAEDFLRSKSSIHVSLDPAEPIPLQRFQAGIVDEALIAALNPTVVSPAPAAGAVTVDAATDPLGAAQALLSGEGALQDREAGAAALLRLAEGGDTQAVLALAGGFGAGAAPDLSSADLAGLFEYLLVGRALGADVADAALADLAGRLGPMAARGAEVAADDYFRAHAPENQAAAALSADTVAGFSPAELRAMAYDAYEGRGTPRDFTRAYAVALVAAAAGDRLAEALRDDLAAAARDKRLVLSLEEGRAQAAPLWAAYAAAASVPQAPDAPDAQPAEAQPEEQPVPAEEPPVEPQPEAPQASPPVNTPLPTPQAQ